VALCTGSIGRDHLDPSWARAEQAVAGHGRLPRGSGTGFWASSGDGIIDGLMRSSDMVL